MQFLLEVIDYYEVYFYTAGTKQYGMLIIDIMIEEMKAMLLNKEFTED
jgi:hypothetical protein